MTTRYADWKLELIMWKTFQLVWTNGQEDIRVACQMIRECYQEGKDNDTELLAALNAKRIKIEKRRNGLIEMRADGEISKDDFMARRDECDKELADLEGRLETLNSRAGGAKGMEDTLEKALSAMNQMADFSGGVIDHDLLEGLVTRIVHVGDYEFDVYLNLGIVVPAGGYGTEEKTIRIKRFSSPQPEGFIREHRLRLYDLKIDFEQANAYRKMRGKYLRKNQWNNLTVHVYV